MLNNKSKTQKKEMSSFQEISEIIIPKISSKKQQSIYLRKATLFNRISVFLSILFLFLYIYKTFQYKTISQKHNELHQKILDYIFYPYHSDVISDINELRLLKNWIKQSTQLPQKAISFRMILKATVHGDSSKLFHQKTDGSESYLILIKDNYDNKFGGFTNKNFGSSKFFDFSWEVNIEDKNAFLFNLNEKKIYPIKQESIKQALTGDTNNGPIFGGDGDLIIVDQFLTKNSSCGFPKNYGNGTEAECEITKGKNHFLVVEMEVFQVYFDDIKR